jgi:radical SAM/Cys-rich protein
MSFPANSFDRALQSAGLSLLREQPEVLQLNLGKLCNLTCTHCHVNAGPHRREIMTQETADRILDWFERTSVPYLDLTGGSPEMMPCFRPIIERVRGFTRPRRLSDRLNATILMEPGYEDLAEFLACHEVELIASMPCYSPENVTAQRGEGVFDASIAAFQTLNALGYGRDPRLPLHLVYNPVDASLPPKQNDLEADYKREMERNFGIVFNSLYALANMPIARFASWLKREGLYQEYLAVLAESFNPATVPGLMCRNTINVSWLGEVFDCDFNQMLDLRLPDAQREGETLFVWDVDPGSYNRLPIRTGVHCFGCTAGHGSSCGGALVAQERKG